MLTPANSGKPKFFIDLRALAVTIRDDKIANTTLWESGFFYLECTRKDLADRDGAAIAVLRSVLPNTRTPKGEEFAEAWRVTLLRALDKGVSQGRVAWRERRDTRRLSVLQALLKRARGGDKDYQEIEARDFFDAIPTLRYYCDVIG